MAFDLNKYRKNISNFQKKCLYDVTCEELPKLAYLAKAVEFKPGSHLNLIVAEEEGLTVYEILKELKENRYDLKVNFYARDGSTSKSIFVKPSFVSFWTSLDWESDDIMMWEVNILE